MNHYPIWKYLLIVFVLAAAFLYAAPNLYGEYPAVQIMGSNGARVDQATLSTVAAALQKAQLPYRDTRFQEETLLFRFTSTEDQLKAKEVAQQALGDQYIVALNLSPATPPWLQKMGAYPMKLGLDLRGGVHFLLQVDVDAVMQERVQGDLHGIGRALRDAHIRYNSLNREAKNTIILQFRDMQSREDAYHFVMQHYPEFTWTPHQVASAFSLEGVLAPASLYRARAETLEQTMNTLRHRVNELGVSEAIVQSQGENRVSVDLPGIQDTAQAKNILGKTATLEFHMVETGEGLAHGEPLDARLYTYQGRPIYLKNQIILHGSSIVSATAGFGEEGRSNVSVRLNGSGESLFTQTTTQNVGKPMAVVYVEVLSTPITENKKTTIPPAFQAETPRDELQQSPSLKGAGHIQYQTTRRIISVATIQSALGSNFQITGLRDANEARTLALLLRAGALPAPVTIIEERQIGPSLGEANIRMGELSVIAGMALVVIFMACYYGLFGLIADFALVMNLVLIVALLSLLGATLSLPGMAGIVLTVGMAVDANVLIFERIREELRKGAGVQASIHAGYNKAFTTILDANITTLIVMLILFSLGSGVIKGIAITVTIGLMTSMFTAITGTRAIVNLAFGRRAIKHLPIGI
jgi:preprotein translocase subunit SecD